MDIKLSKRLQSIADYVEQGENVLDVGTDHALLASFLIKEDIAPFVLAGDVHKNPLEGAKKTVRDLGLCDRISLRLGNGLEVLKDEPIDTVIIAGMGGVLIRDILEAGKEKLADVQKLILQPNLAADKLRVWALENNWQIVAESFIEEEGLFYEILVLKKGKMRELTEEEIVLGPFLLKEQNSEFLKYYQKIYQKEQDIIKSLEKVKSKNALEKKIVLEKKWQNIKRVIKCL